GYGSIPDGFEDCGTQPHRCGIVRKLITYEFAVAGEVAEPDQAIVEQPEVVARQREIRRAAAGEPPHQFAGREVGERDVVLEPDVVRDRFADDPGAPDLDAAGGRFGHIRMERHPPARAVGRILAVPRLPRETPWGTGRARVTQLQVYS